MSNELTTRLDANVMEQVLIGGDLSKLSPAQRVQYYQKVCESIGLNPLTKPFDYIVLNGKMTLYAKKDATDQLRKINSVSINDVDLQETTESYIVKVKGSDSTGRSDVEIGVVKKTDMQGNAGNAQMKAVTKAKRRLTLSLCGLGWLDETEIETIPTAKPVVVDTETGEINQTVDAEVVPEPVLHNTKEFVPEASTGNNSAIYSRPMAPDALSRALSVKAEKYGNIKVNAQQIGLTAAMIETCFSGQEQPEKIRHSITKYLFGKDSLNEISGAEVKALLDWLKPVKDSGGAYIPDAMAQKEITSLWTAALKSAGQEELPL